jgi:hypothetical protein
MATLKGARFIAFQVRDLQASSPRRDGTQTGWLTSWKTRSTSRLTQIPSSVSKGICACPGPGTRRGLLTKVELSSAAEQAAATGENE